jgi:hypothetical protein
MVTRRLTWKPAPSRFWRSTTIRRYAIKCRQYARQRALTFSWEAVFGNVYAKYEDALSSGLLKKFNEDRSRPASLLEA